MSSTNMNTSNIVKVIVGVGLALGICAFFGVTPFGQSVVQQTTTQSGAGSTFSTAKIAEVIINPSVVTASSSSILNTDVSARIITDSVWSCSGSNGQGLSVVGATTSVTGVGLNGNINYFMNSFATTTVASQIEYVASSTEGIQTYTNRLWPAGTYATFVMGTTSTFVGNAGSCQVAVHYLAS